jgi:succinate-semialdehyde dehydrogenase/glutarate-semialdehyde dehydrogenase
MLRSVNPATGDEIAHYAILTPDEVEGRLRRTVQAFERNRTRSLAQRADLLRRTADLLDARTDALASLMTREMGKPIGQARAEVAKCAWVCRHYAERGAAYLADEPVDTDALRSYVRHEPLGPVLAVMPWNYPLWQVFRFAAPTLMAGGTGLLKHARNVTGCSLAIEQLWQDAGADDALLSLPISSDRVAGLIADRRVRAVTLTGSEAAGRAVASAAGQALKPSLLELGGSDPFVVLEGADLDAAADAAVQSRMQNNGQSCIAAKRWIVEAAVHDAFLARVTDRIDALTVGDPEDDATDIGPLARVDLRDEMHEQVLRAAREGAQVVRGGRVTDRPGAWYPPTLLAGVRAGSVAFEEEIFGPVAALVQARNAEHAIRLANASRFGLGSAVFAATPDEGEAVARRLHAGAAFVNGLVKSDPRLPFGGIGESGYGRELGADGIRAFCNRKTVWVGA